MGFYEYSEKEKRQKFDSNIINEEYTDLMNVQSKLDQMLDHYQQNSASVPDV